MSEEDYLSDTLKGLIKAVPNPKHSDVMKGRPSNNKGKTLKKHKCKYCGIEAAGGNIARWHNENCSNKSSSELHNE